MTAAGAPDPRPAWGEVGIHGIHRQRRWDTVAVVDAGLPDAGDEIVAVVFDRATVVELGPSELDITELAVALQVEPPYRLEAVRRADGLWAVGANRIAVVDLGVLRGQELELSFDGRERSVVIDGSPTLAGIPELEELGAKAAESYVVRANRLHGSAWEVDVSPL